MILGEHYYSNFKRFCLGLFFLSVYINVSFSCCAVFHLDPDQRSGVYEAVCRLPYQLR